ncbi:hypothetical protein B0J11DRAFT_160348 [Dendryphion nanum]|uniref:Uncharacterized protein n=1 Tax=Dendryphion nanum TaxID=256645 RepID=A0A9P9EE60_9PLEO|nr:hypothetical protein B0J11DRAFT_160348 [Dendryphion nanum]
MHVMNTIVDRTSLFSCLVKFMQVNSSHAIDFDMSELVTTMMETFYADDGHMSHNWFISAKNMPSMIFNFIRTRDCFVDTCPLPSMQVQLNCDRLSSDSVIIVDVERQIPIIDFQGLAPTLPPGAEYRISPTYHHRILSSRFCSFPTEPCFSLHLDDHSKMALTWSAAQHCFRGIVPNVDSCYHLTRSRSRIVAATICFATITTLFPKNIRFEQTTRYRIILSLDLPSLRDMSGEKSPAGQQLSYSNTPTSSLNREEDKFYPFLGDSNYDADSDTSMCAYTNDNSLRSLQYTGSDTVNKPKAGVEVPNDSMLAASADFARGRFAIDSLDHNISMNTSPERPRLDSLIKSGLSASPTGEDIFSSKSLVLKCLNTGVLGEASVDPSPKGKSLKWYRRLSPEYNGLLERKTRSRAYQADNAKVLLSLKKKGSVKRVIMHRGRQATRRQCRNHFRPKAVAKIMSRTRLPHLTKLNDQKEDERDCDTNLLHDQEEAERELEREIDAEMCTYKKNYAMFLKMKSGNTGYELLDETQDTEMERAFVSSDSREDFWGTQSSASSSPMGGMD